jgi:hypothetical protein
MPHNQLPQVIVQQLLTHMCLEQGPLILVRTIEELLERKSSGSALENREHGCRDSSQ